MYQQFATERDREERGLTDKKSNDPTSPTVQRGEKQRTGNTIYVSGNKVTEEFLRTHFNTFGKIVNVSMEIEKGRGFITFQTTRAASRAIEEMHSKAIAGIQLQVQLARRQPQIEPINDASSSAVWSTLGKYFRFLISINVIFRILICLLFSCCLTAASHSQKGSHKDKREMVEYEDLLS